MNTDHRPSHSYVESPVEGLILGESDAIRRLREAISHVAPLNIPVLIQGPTGSGKELVAKALHGRSRRPGRMVAFSVVEIPDSMFEDRLFGHTKGSFTGAVREVEGYLTQADKGTVFFDEVGALAPEIQPKLLRVLETHSFYPLGAERERYSDFRLVSALNEPLRDLVATGRFRADFAERISTVVIDVPPLASRPEDIPLLVQHFVSLSPANPRRESIAFTDGAIRVLQEQPWPRHVRQLRNVVDRALIEARSARCIGVDMIRAVLARDSGSHTQLSTADRQLRSVLEETGWHTGRAAERLGVDRTTIHRRMRRLGIDLRRERDRFHSEVPLP